VGSGRRTARQLEAQVLRIFCARAGVDLPALRRRQIYPRPKRIHTPLETQQPASRLKDTTFMPLTVENGEVRFLVDE